ncbi:uncharacterized protein LOC118153609 [Callithrix jacchus]
MTRRAQAWRTPGGAGAGRRRARFHGTGAAGAARPLGTRFQSLPVEQEQAELSGHPASGVRPAAPLTLPAACDAWWGRAAAVPSAERRTAPAPQAPHTNFCLASPTSALGSHLRSRNCAPRTARAAVLEDQPRRGVLAAVALVLLRSGGCRRAARKRPAARSRHVSGARALRNAPREQMTARPTPDPLRTPRPEPRRGRGQEVRADTCGGCGLSLVERGSQRVLRELQPGSGDRDRGPCTLHPVLSRRLTNFFPQGLGVCTSARGVCVCVFSV